MKLTKVLLFLAFFCYGFNAWACVTKCLPKINVTFYSTKVKICSTKDLSNVVFKFCDDSHKKYDNLSGYCKTFYVKDVVGVWVKSGCNSSNDGPGYGEYFANKNVQCVKPTPTPKPTCTPKPTPTPKPSPSPSPTPCLVYDCFGVCDGTAVVDECGVCGGNNSTCLDCLGVPNGSAIVDSCGICEGNNECLDCAGVPYGEAKFDLCGVCEGSNECLDCAGTPNGSAIVDSCGVCEGSNECLDCAGTPNGSAIVDLCGVCDGINDCLDCLGVPNGSAKVDLCGVCEGTNDCLDCTGTPNGTATFDECGVCDGPGKSLVVTSLNKKFILSNLKNILRKRTLPYYDKANNCNGAFDTKAFVKSAKKTYRKAVKDIQQLVNSVELCPEECVDELNKKQVKKSKRSVNRAYLAARHAQTSAINFCGGGSNSSNTKVVTKQTKKLIDLCKQTVCN